MKTFISPRYHVPLENHHLRERILEWIADHDGWIVDTHLTRLTERRFGEDPWEEVDFLIAEGQLSRAMVRYKGAGYSILWLLETHEDDVQLYLDEALQTGRCPTCDERW